MSEPDGVADEGSGGPVSSAQPWPDRIRAARWRGRALLAEHPRLYLPIAARRYPDGVIGDDTELVIDGFTRSAVTFASIAFQLVQERPVRVAHTLHAVGHIRAAVSRRLPVLVTARNPDDVALSAVIREPFLNVRTVLAAYARFYGRLLPERERIVVGPFDRVVTDLGSVIDELNHRFGTRFSRFPHTQENVELAYAIIEDRARRPPWLRDLGRFQAGMIDYPTYRARVERLPAGSTGTEAIPERRIPRPSAERAAVKDAIRAALDDPGTRDVRRRAARVYERFVGG
jgi:hypothetical protein